MAKDWQKWGKFSEPVSQLAVNWDTGGNPQIVVGLEGRGGIEYYNGSQWVTSGPYQGEGWRSAITQMAVQWGSDGSPSQIVVGLADGAVIYYNTQSGWRTINNFGKSVTQLSVQWQESSNPNIVVGLDNSEVQSYQGNNGSWTQLHNDRWAYPVQQMAVQWTNPDAQPLVVVGLGDDNGNNGTVWYYQGSLENGGWTSLKGLPSEAAIAQMAVQWNVSPSPNPPSNVNDLKIVVGQVDSTVSYYNGDGWTATPTINSSLQIKTLNSMNVKWSANGDPQISVGLGDTNYGSGELWYLADPSQSWQQLDGSSNYTSPVTQIDSLWTESLVPNSQADNLSYVLFGSDFNQTVNQTGTIGDDVMLGTPTGESFVAGQGDDQIYTNGGLDVVYAGPGDDFVSVTDTYFRRLDGGTGFDVLELHGYNDQDWDLTKLSPGVRLQNFEALDIRNYGANKITLNALTVTNLSEDNTITVLTDGEDTVELSSDFQFNGLVYQANQKFAEYVSKQSAATVLVNRSAQYQLLLNTVGSLVLLSPTGEQLWAAENSGQVVIGATDAVIQNSDGNFVLYKEEGNGQRTVLWATATNPNRNDYVQLGDDGGLYIISESGEVLKTLYDNNGTTNPKNDNNSKLLASENQQLFNGESLSSPLFANVIFGAPETNHPEPILLSKEINPQQDFAPTTTSSQSTENKEPTANDSNAPTQLFVHSSRVSEAMGEASFVIERTGDLDKYVLVSYLTQDMDGKAGDRYLPVAGQLVFAPGETKKTVTVQIPNDGIYTGDRQFGLLVSLLARRFRVRELEPGVFPSR